jgi:hypothetical protein
MTAKEYLKTAGYEPEGDFFMLIAFHMEVYANIKARETVEKTIDRIDTEIKELDKKRNE